MKITDLSADQNKVQPLEILSDDEAINITGGDRNGSGDPCPPLPTEKPFLLSYRGYKFNSKKTIALIKQNKSNKI